MKPNKPKHTPGPWYALKYPDVKTYTVAAKESVASKIKTIEDAHLIAAAPEMLEALEICLNYFNYAEEQEAFEYAKEVRKLIAKAKGDVK